ncbi:hypothetical protein GCM10028833_22760 [Glycomyces tarimensis]
MQVGQVLLERVRERLGRLRQRHVRAGRQRDGAAGAGWGDGCGPQAGGGGGDHGGEQCDAEAGFDEAGDGVGGAAVDGDDGGESGGFAGGDGDVAQVVAVCGEDEGLVAQLGESDVGLVGEWGSGCG